MSDISVLVVDDETSVLKAISTVLKHEQIDVTCAQSSKDAFDYLDAQSFDIILLDIMMPEQDGFSFLKELREHQILTPVILLSGREEDAAQVEGLGLGADDYMTKPFDPLEVVARVNSALRRFYHLNGEPESKNENHILKVGDLVLDTQTLALKKRDEEVFLTPMEYKILALFMKNPGMIFTKVQIYENTCGEYVESDDNTIMVHISNLREKIEENPKNPQYIKTIRGVGYKIENR